MNSKCHMAVGAGLGFGIYYFVKKNRAEELTLGGTLGCIALGALAARLPDLLEPATSPNHRSFFHSAAFATTFGVSAYKYRQRLILKKEVVPIWADVLVAALASHLLLDGLTPRGLPLLS